MDACTFGLPTTWRGHRRAVVSPRIRAHYEEHVGPIPHGFHVHHTCGDPACSNPAHLEAVSFTEHVERHRYRDLWRGFAETAF